MLSLELFEFVNNPFFFGRQLEIPELLESLQHTLLTLGESLAIREGEDNDLSGTGGKIGGEMDLQLVVFWNVHGLFVCLHAHLQACILPWSAPIKADRALPVPPHVHPRQR